jgi:hypothetical protein
LVFSSLASAGGVFIVQTGSTPIPTPVLPPSQISVIGMGLGNAVMADGTLYNATAFNPALLGRAPSTLELPLLPAANISNDDISVYNTLTNGFSFDPGTAFQDIANGYLNNNVALENQGINAVTQVTSPLTNKALEVGVSDNFAIKFTPNFGVQVYNSTHLVGEVIPGTILADLQNAQVGAAVTAMQNAVVSTINGFIPISQQTTAIKNDINQYETGQIGLTQAVSQIESDAITVVSQSTLQNIQNNLETNLITALAKDLATMETLGYSDTVAMATIAFNPLEDFPLTVGINAKVVQRYFAWVNDFVVSTNTSSELTALENDFDTPSTRIGFDLGLLYAFETDLSLGISFQDLVKTIDTLHLTDVGTGAPITVVTDPAPTVTNIGLSWHPIPEFVLNADCEDLFSTTSLYPGMNFGPGYDFFGHMNFGGALTLAGILQLRGGFEYNNFVGGAGVQLGFLEFQGSYGIDPLTDAYNYYGQFQLLF